MATSVDTTNNLASAVANTLSITDNDLLDLIKIQGDLVRKLKAEKVSKEQIDAAVAKLLELKKELASHQETNGEDATAGGDKILKTPRVSIPHSAPRPFFYGCFFSGHARLSPQSDENSRAGLSNDY